MTKKQNKTFLKRALRRKEKALREEAPYRDIMVGRVARRGEGRIRT